MNPLFSIWTQPSATIRYIVDHKSLKYPFIIISISALINSIMAFADLGLFNGFSLLTTLGLVLLSGLLSGLAGWGIIIVAYTWIGKLLGGTGTMRKMGLATGASAIPMIWTAPIGFIAISLYGQQLFTTPTGPLGTNMSVGFFFFQTWLMLAISIFGLIIECKAIGIVHNFSAWRGFGTLMLFTGFIIIISIIIFGALFSILLAF
ncbi:Yip1 domain-containing protein [Sporosarcina sp. ANT_H38]|uniref:YIP1 family protein n=1 Tax=Sporosarcina sp. ANT_H38 TaxID=2597358 RepID=UPI00165DBF8F|nr:YIP1 family protein [Sporosarcina sp. ANT_H38]